jgi:undecaprenyl-diphosphatase
LRLTPERIAVIDDFFARHGPKTIFLARFVTGLQTVAALFAGMARMPWRSFLIYNIAGAITWAVAYSLAGYFFGESWAVLHMWVGRAAIFGAALLFALTMMAVMLSRYGAPLGRQLEQHLPVALSLRAVAIALISLGAAGVFAKIAEDVVHHESTSFDTVLTLKLHALDSPAMDLVMRVASVLGSAPVVATVAALIVIWAIKRSDRRAALVVSAVAILTEVLNLLFKLSFQRARPSLFVEVETLHSYSFPSGHAMATVSIYGICAIIAARLRPEIGFSAAVITIVIDLLIGLSRVFLGLHWPTDVLAGYAAGAFVLLGGVYALGGFDTGVRSYGAVISGTEPRT